MAVRSYHLSADSLGIGIGGGVSRESSGGRYLGEGMNNNLMSFRA